MSGLFYEKRSENLFAGFICDHPFPTHVHDPVEMVYITHGTVRMTVDGLSRTLGPGETAVIFPVIAHSYDEVSPDAQGLTLIFLPETISQFTRVFRTSFPACPFGRLDVNNKELMWTIGQLSQPREDEGLTTAYLHVFLAHVLPTLVLQNTAGHMESGLSYRVLHYISEHFTEDISLESTAQALGVSRIHLSHIFSQKLRINFRQYINTLRIDQACRLLAEPQYSVAQVAEECGYANPRTFHRAFLSQCGMPPNQFRAQLASVKTEFRQNR